ncbi:MAG: hypothetical protein ACT4P2_06770 [Pseudomonadota bacterium]
MMRRASPPLWVSLAVALAAAEAGAQGFERAAEVEVAREFLALELAGWRLPDPTVACLASLALQRLAPMAFGSLELVDQPELVDPPGPHYRILRIDPEPGDRRRRIVSMEWLLKRPDGPVSDSFVFAINDAAGGIGAASMLREPERLVVRRECFNG